MAKDFEVTITNPGRAAEFEAVFGTATVNVLSPIPEYANLPGKEGPSLIFHLDLELITAEQRQRLVEYISQKWNLPAAEVEAEIEARGVPILDEDCTVAVLNPQKWFSPDDVEEAHYPEPWEMWDDDDDDDDWKMWNDDEEDF